MDGDQIRRSSSDRDLEYNRCRRNGVHYATIAEFLASLNTNDTTLGSAEGRSSLSLEDYLQIVRGGPEKQSGDGDKAIGRIKIRKTPVQDISSQMQSDSKNSSESKLISQFTEKIWI
ncbi:uncharacterized protein LOC6551470 [Drosophila erecta]|uniref:Uncharacterized protein n=1 Tax=Drosophila erecta TaxID=7220 RepID=B3NTR5_DROER|nr:uncharacterized protein LOC6551470 [Drosophila erecta]EDV47478.1 uncharacterized protein Dere_GG19649 [Drosophila erecta]